LAADGMIVAYREDRNKNSHARVLNLLIEDMLQEAGKTFADVDAFAVSAGPGSYTGLRIGVSAAKGFCYALNKKLIGVPTLLSLASAIKAQQPSAQYIMPVIDARREDVFSAVYDAELNEVLPTAMYTLNADLQQRLSEVGAIVIGGDCIEKCKAALPDADIAYAEGIACTARLLVPFAEAYYNANQFVDLAYYEPLYINEPVKLVKKQK
jgi:tRNA threonylcarbamoyladenosine biosynthesis protein TsaB